VGRLGKRRGRHCPRDEWYLSGTPEPSLYGPSVSKFGLMKRALPLTASLALVLAACGGSSTTEPTETVPAGALVVTAKSGLRFDAAEYGPVPAGDVTFGYVNEDSMRHTLIIAKGDEKVGSFKLVVVDKGDVDSGSVSLEAGEYTLICDVPGHSNMRATLTVE
jgi:plastocyanin